jgi:diaminopropionate ammonia-lyase
MRRLARPLAADPAIVAGESGGAGLAGLMVACGDRQLREVLELRENSSILLFISEGATAPARYRELVGLDPAMVVARRSQSGEACNEIGG